MKVGSKIKVMLVDDHTLMRDGINAMLTQEDDFYIVGTSSSGEEAVNNFRCLDPDVIIMDIIMNGMTGIEATRWIKERNSEIKVILLSMNVNKEYLQAGIQSGIDGYLPKDVEKEMLVKAIREVYNNGKFFNEAITNLIFEIFINVRKAVPKTKII